MGGLCAPRRENCVVKWPRQDGGAIMAAGVSPLRAASGQMERPLARRSRADEFLLLPLSDGWGQGKKENGSRPSELLGLLLPEGMVLQFFFFFFFGALRQGPLSIVCALHSGCSGKQFSVPP